MLYTVRCTTYIYWYLLYFVYFANRSLSSLNPEIEDTVAFLSVFLSLFFASLAFTFCPSNIWEKSILKEIKHLDNIIVLARAE